MDQVEQIKQKLNVVDVVSEYVELKKSGINYKGLCPFHSEKTSSFMVSPELQIFKCFGCGRGGDMYTFVQDIEGIDFSEALTILAEKAGIKLQKTKPDPEKNRKSILYEINHLTAQYYHFILTEHKIGKNALAYLKDKRALKISTIKEFKIGYAPDSWESLFNFLSKKKYSLSDLAASGVVVQKKSGQGYTDKFRGRIIFPFEGAGDSILGFSGRDIVGRDPKYLNTAETLVFHKSSFLFGLNKAKVAIRKEGVVFVEGPFDVLSASQAGIQNVVATSGTALTTAHLKTVSRYTKDIIFCFDSDSAGFLAMSRAIELAEKDDFNVRVAILPDKYQDLDEYIVSDSKEVGKFLKSAVSVYDFFLAATLKNHDKNDPIGKKKIVAELVPIYSKIKNTVTLEYHVKKLSETLNIGEETILKLLKGLPAENVSWGDAKGTNVDNNDMVRTQRKSAQEYVLALILRVPLDTAQTILYKLAQKDFTDPTLEDIFTILKNHLLGRKRKFDIKSFSSKFNDEKVKELVQDMYLWDIGDLALDPDFIERELYEVFARVKNATIKRELKDLSAKIKDAERVNDKPLLKELSEKFKDLSRKLS